MISSKCFFVNFECFAETFFGLIDFFLNEQLMTQIVDERRNGWMVCPTDVLANSNRLLKTMLGCLILTKVFKSLA